MRKWTFIGGSANQIFYNDHNLVKLNCASAESFGCNMSYNANRSWMGGCTMFKRLILPSITSFNTPGYGPTYEIIDLGVNLSSIGGNYTDCYKSASLIIRATNPEFSTNAVPSSISKIFVPAISLEEYKASSKWSSVISKIYAIGSEEWVAKFGSADEYADLTEQEYADTYGWLAEQEQE